MNIIREIERINQTELDNGIHGGLNSSWHAKYKDSAWVYIGGLSLELTEGDIICFMSQWGEIEDINLVRDEKTNKSLGYAFLKYEDQRSTILAVDNFNGIKLLGRVLRCDHVDRYKLPKEIRKKEESRLEEDPSAEVTVGPGHAYSNQELATEFNVTKGQDLWSKPSVPDGDESVSSESNASKSKSKKHKKKKHKKHKSDDDKPKEKQRHKSRYDSEDEDDDGYRKRLKSNKDDYPARPSRDEYRNRDYPRSTSKSRSRSRERHNEPFDRDRKMQNTSQSVAYNPTNTKPLPNPDVHSWRGKRDPALAIAAEAEKKRLENADQLGNRRNEFDGMAGLTRIR